jgi:protein-S-isoprenylcysteine O-methyltransferase Ste14
VNEALVFRIVFAALFLGLFGLVSVYRSKAQAGRKIDYSKEGSGLFLALRLGGLTIWLYCFVYILYPAILGWSFFELPVALRWAGAALVVATMPLIVSAQKHLGRNVSPTVITHDDHELVTTGPYRWIRNPLYTSGASIFTGLGLVAGSWLLLAGSALALVLVALRLPKEEAELEARFGQEYRDYVGRTGRFLPRLRS